MPMSSTKLASELVAEDRFGLWNPLAALFDVPLLQNFGRSILGFLALYLSWFILLVAPGQWVRWRGIARVFAGVPFRWPIRLEPYIDLAVLVGAIVLLSNELANHRQRRRAFISASGIAVGAHLS
ncbi:MAG: hypothetical protein ACI91Q_001331 [Gammaproteobacteria bacterium]|jgi:hypothetical protein